MFAIMATDAYRNVLSFYGIRILHVDLFPEGVLGYPSGEQIVRRLVERFMARRPPPDEAETPLAPWSWSVCASGRSKPAPWVSSFLDALKALGMREELCKVGSGTMDQRRQMNKLWTDYVVKTRLHSACAYTA